jgi:hypothetical protein
VEVHNSVWGEPRIRFGEKLGKARERCGFEGLERAQRSVSALALVPTSKLHPIIDWIALPIMDWPTESSRPRAPTVREVHRCPGDGLRHMRADSSRSVPDRGLQAYSGLSGRNVAS